MTERALFVGSEAEVPESLDGFGRLYLGTETCQWLLPEAAALARARERAARLGAGFTLVTPLLDDEGLDRALRLLDGWEPSPGDEVVVNDFGLLEAAREQGWSGELVVGRLLTRQRRGAVWKPPPSPPPAGAARYLAGSALDSPGWAGYLVERYGVRRFEIDLLPGGQAPDALPEGVHLSVHTPWLPVTLTRNCPWRPPRLPRNETCPAPCRGRELRLVQAGAPPLVMRGNALFMRLDDAGGMSEADRLVLKK